MRDERWEALRRLGDDSEALLRTARAAAQAPAEPGTDASGSVTATLDADGRVTRVAVAADWRRRVDADRLAEAVAEAVRDASMRRLAAWGTVFGSDADGVPAATPDPAESQQRLPEPGDDLNAALTGLLELFEAVERGIDEVSEGLRTTLDATHTGRSADGYAGVSLSGGGDVLSVRLDPAWLREAPAADIGRQVVMAFHSAYELVAAHGVQRLIADSALGEVQRAVQDPVGLARRLRIDGEG
ncbi:YbaB/EbfC family nucleoid-associated protein [Actinoplanes aureus]|uniref:YbaB/EbfC family nucleoid-associated protein n=1 Tax=Actinoplanes aureus TaxID=2792083 RepID=A0A931C639_9ACTN|nr:YbaB/EbfC family nucleoid-associated protein [Actinoplanes aureus]MBG0564099.1 YbaB/EbfC family nucleoid-associated protein [Actinoplanes aureus]